MQTQKKLMNEPKVETGHGKPHDQSLRRTCQYVSKPAWTFVPCKSLLIMYTVGTHTKRASKTLSMLACAKTEEIMGSVPKEDGERREYINVCSMP
jgi:hypothetical protein